jgi:N-acetylglucosamine-6-sulfatase
MNNLLFTAEGRPSAREMETRLYDMMDEMGGANIPLNRPRGNSSNIRLRSRGGEQSADFPAPMVVDEPPNRNAK